MRLHETGKMKRLKLIKSMCWLGLTVVLVLAPLSSAWSQDKRILFYEPDANHHAIVQITNWFNQYLQASNLSYKFQPVQSAKDFEAQLRNENVSFVIVSVHMHNHAGKHRHAYWYWYWYENSPRARQ